MKQIFRRSICGLIVMMLLNSAVFTRSSSATNLPFHPEPNSGSDYFRMENKVDVSTLVTLIRYITEDDMSYSEYKKIRVDINCDGVVDIMDYCVASDFLQKSATVEADMMNHEAEWSSATNKYCELLAQISGCKPDNITIVRNVYPDIIIPLINIGRRDPVQYVVEQVFSYSDGGGSGTVTSMPDPYYNRIEYSKEIDASKTVMTLIVYQYKNDGVAASIIGTADYII